MLEAETNFSGLQQTFLCKACHWFVFPKTISNRTEEWFFPGNLVNLSEVCRKKRGEQPLPLLVWGCQLAAAIWLIWCQFSAAIRLIRSHSCSNQGCRLMDLMHGHPREKGGRGDGLNMVNLLWFPKLGTYTLYWCLSIWIFKCICICIWNKYFLVDGDWHVVVNRTERIPWPWGGYTSLTDNWKVWDKIEVGEEIQKQVKIQIQIQIQIRTMWSTVSHITHW